MNLNIDIVDQCNLRCPSCPRGRDELPVSKDQMSVQTLRTILENAAAQTKIHSIQLYDNTEPTLHKNLPEMIRTAKEFAFVEISTNASIPKVDWDTIIAAGVDRITISIGGGSQETQGKNHLGSKIETVWWTMREIDNAIRWQYAKTKVKVLYHRYKYNLHEEVVVRKLVKRINSKWEFAPLFATQLFPFSNIPLIEGLILDPHKAKEICKKWPAKDKWCLILDQNINMNCRGEVALCPGLPDRIGSFLKESLEKLQQKRHTHPVCVNCRATGYSHYVCREPHTDKASALELGDTWQYRIQCWRHWLFHCREVLTR